MRRSHGERFRSVLVVVAGLYGALLLGVGLGARPWRVTLPWTSPVVVERVLRPNENVLCRGRLDIELRGGDVWIRCVSRGAEGRETGQ